MRRDGGKCYLLNPIVYQMLNGFVSFQTNLRRYLLQSTDGVNNNTKSNYPFSDFSMSGSAKHYTYSH